VIRVAAYQAPLYHAVLQAVIRYVPEGTYELAIRLGYNSDDALRVAIGRQLGVGLRDICKLDVTQMTDEFFNVLASDLGELRRIATHGKLGCGCHA
jgi:hypothetical protein